MNKITFKKALIGLSIFVGLAFLVFSLISKEKVEVSKVNWEIVSGQYLVSFKIENKSQKQFATKLNIMLHHRNFAGGSPKAEVLDLVGQKNINISLSPSQSKKFDELVKPKSLAFKVDMVTINILDIQTN